MCVCRREGSVCMCASVQGSRPVLLCCCCFCFFLCGPAVDFMIYSAKGRGARPPVTTERAPHVGLMISPQKCLLWLGPQEGGRWGVMGGVEGERRRKRRREGLEESVQVLTLIHIHSFSDVGYPTSQRKCSDIDGDETFISVLNFLLALWNRYTSFLSFPIFLFCLER